MTRVIAGAARGRRLAVPAGRLTRPTSDRAREGLFGTLVALHGPLDGASLLDLYAGSGAVGLEALSRGARRVLFVEADGRAARVIRGNIAAVGLDGAELVTDRVERLLSRGPAGLGSRGPAGAAGGPDGPGGPGGLAAGGLGGYDLAVADPPYAVTGEEVTGMLAALAAGGWLAPGAVVAVERATRSGPVGWPEGYTQDRSRRYGDTTFWYGLAAGAQRTPQTVREP